MKVIYLANARIPTEKAHGGQIMSMCAALADAGASVELWHPRRTNRPVLARQDPFDHYGVTRSFALHTLPCIDLFPLARRLDSRLGTGALAFWVQTLSYLLAARWRLRRATFDALYTRDPAVLLAMRLAGLGARTFYEAHRFPGSRRGRRLHRYALHGAGGVITITERLRELYAELGASRLHLARDAVHLARFDEMPGKAAARRALGLPEGAFIAGYVGRFHTMHMAKGIDTLVAAAARCDAVHICLVGGPAAMVEALRGILPGDRLHYLGQVPPADVPGCLAAFDVCTMPFPWTEHFAYYASPVKLFEYMASRRPIVATDLPSTREVVTHEETALLVAPGDPGALAAALKRLAGDPALGVRLAASARELVEGKYTWPQRAAGVLAFVRCGLAQDRKEAGCA